MGRLAPRRRRRPPGRFIAGLHATKEAGGSATSARAPFKLATAAGASLAAPSPLDRTEQCCGVWLPTLPWRGSASCSFTSTVRRARAATALTALTALTPACTAVAIPRRVVAGFAQIAGPLWRYERIPGRRGP